MNTRLRTIVIALLGMLVGAVAGAYAGARMAVEFTAGFFADAHVSRYSDEVTAQVAMLRQLRSGQLDQGIELAEGRLDHDIVALRIDERFAAKTNLRVAQAIRDARTYRAEHPRHTTIEGWDDAVNRVLREGMREPMH